ncbi:CCR4-NOT regulatory complex component [Marasmius crinis-equi]|uniref:CCR4-NOT regulatory complex component n=1 Tax=Marasmius crinis-equi TaxID=585013 RepID=A0ABR3FSY0_9AGAR
MGSSNNAVDIHDLTFTHILPGTRIPATPDPALRNVNFSLPKGSRTLLIGGNGAGKSTLLTLLSGKRLIREGKMTIFGRDVFRDLPQNVTYLGTEWAMNARVRSDIVVSNFLDSVGGYRHKQRRDHLLNVLDVNLDWCAENAPIRMMDSDETHRHMHAISDGERRRVQLVMGLMGEWDLLLLDEVTVDLDVLVRSELLKFLAQESKTRNATIIYATHIFDGLNEFPTHVAHMRDGAFVLNPTPWPLNPSLLPPESKMIKTGTLLHSVALMWLSEDRALRLREEREGKRPAVRGARIQAVPTNSESFYKKRVAIPSLPLDVC